MAQRVTDQLVGALQDFQDSLTSRQSQEFFADYNGTALKSTGAVHAFVAHIDSSPQRRPFPMSCKSYGRDAAVRGAVFQEL